MLTTNPTPTAPQPRPGARPLVVVAEDSPVHRIAMVAMLERAGFEVISAVDGAAALELVASRRPDVLVIDAMMPSVSGFEAIAALRSDSELSTVPTIVVSGLDDVQSRLDAFAIGADDFITKPANSDELVARVKAQLRIADAWNTRTTSMIDRFGEIRRELAESEGGTTPAEAASSLVTHLPTELTCRALMTIDRVAGSHWTRSAHDPRLAEQLTALELAHGEIVNIVGTDATTCPLCGRPAATGAVLATDAGTWETGRAILVAGCNRPGRIAATTLVREVGSACDVILTERLRGWGADTEQSAWLADVIDRGAFDVHFQPIVDLRSGRIHAQEALARFDDGTSPAGVFNAAKTLDRVVDLELGLVGMAIRKAADLPAGVTIHVNVSPDAALDSSLPEILAGTTRAVVLEITENALFGSDHAAALRETLPSNCSLAADDVGAGYAGLSQLLEFRPDVIKVDRAVVTDIHEDPARQALVAGLVQFASATGSTIVAEGIEQREEAEALMSLGVELGQGYFFCRPVPLFEATQQVCCVSAAAPHPAPMQATA